MLGIIVFSASVSAEDNPAVIPASRGGWWAQRHEEKKLRIEQGDVDLIFIGDSITHNFEKPEYQEVWQKYYGKRRAVNLGYSGDRTENVLYRLQHGEIDGISPKVAVLMIGTNNTDAKNYPTTHNAEQLAEGMTAIIKTLREKLPRTKILFLATFPYGEAPNKRRAINDEASRIASKIADGKYIHYLDINDEFLNPDKTMSSVIMPDYLHPTPASQWLWARAMEPKLAELMGDNPFKLNRTLELRQKVDSNCPKGNCSDIIAVLDNRPAFKVLLPENILVNGQWYNQSVSDPLSIYFHVVPGTWNVTDQGIEGRYTVKDIDITVSLDKGGSEIYVTLTVTNTGDEELRDIWANICMALHALPGSGPDNPGWINTEFLSDSVPLDRTLQGRYWFENVTPIGLLALTDNKGWVAMHPYPENPDADAVELYSFSPSEKANARACAVRSLDGQSYCFQAWNSPCRYCTPCPGSACMHLHPFLAEVLKPNTSTSISGIIGVYYGGELRSLRERIDRFLTKTK